MPETPVYLHRDITQLVTLGGVASKQGCQPSEADLGVIENGAIAVDSTTNKILWVGKSSEIPGNYSSAQTFACQSTETWIPQLVECHTHVIYGGDRYHDYALRCAGESYQEIAAKGGGILSTMKATREASKEELVRVALPHLDYFKRTGVGTVEIKSGYGLTLENEIKMLQCIRELAQIEGIQLIPTFLPAHATPPEFKDKTDDYVGVICKEWIPEIAKQKLATFFDVFIEKGFFDFNQTNRLCRAALEHGFQLKLHTDQFTDIGGVPLAIELGAISCDHLDQISDKNIKKLAESNTVAVLLPGASLFTNTPYPPARKLIDEGAIVALSTDYNPGTCPSRNLPLMTTLGCSIMKMTVPEVIAAVTYNAAAALGLEGEIGSLECGKQFRVTKLSTPSYKALPYHFGELGTV